MIRPDSRLVLVPFCAMNTLTSCLCCNACQPRYKRLVDSIYPAAPDLGLVKANMQKLTFYAISHPEKLDRIGDYMANRVSRDIYRLRMGFVRLTLEAMDSLLAACHGSPSLNLFVESFLKVIQKLLETQQPDFEIMATDSFVNFANIQEDTPSYHRRYDFFISRFSALCHSAHPAPNIRNKLRGAGIKGLRGVVRKTVGDELQANIWEKQHMEKIVPSLLFNMHDGMEMDSKFNQLSTHINQEELAEETPYSLADSCLRELIGKATFGNMKCVLQPVLNHFDYHRLWSCAYPPLFAVSCFEAIMYSIHAQYSYVVIQLVINHLDLHSDDTSEIRLGIAVVLSRIVLIAATASIGPTLLEIFNSMLRHLRQSVDMQFSSSDSLSDDTEKQYQEILINTMGDFANNLPDYQKVEIMMFIIGKVPAHTTRRQAEVFLQKVLVRTLLEVATKYRTGHLATVLTSTFLEPLMRLALNDDASVRLLVQHILHTLFDRHGNAQMLTALKPHRQVDQAVLGTVQKCQRTDAMFMRKNGYFIYSTLYKCALMPGNTDDNYAALLCTLLLMCVEVGCEMAIVDSYRLALALQSAALDESSAMSPDCRVQVHNFVARYFSLSSQLLVIPLLCQHAQQVLQARSAPYLDPLLDLLSVRATDPLSIDGAEHVAPLATLLPEEALFDRSSVVEALQSRGLDATSFGMPFVPRPTCSSLVSGGGGGAVSGGDSTDAGSASIDTASLDSSVSLDEYGKRQSRRNTVLGLRMHNGVPAPVTVAMLRQLVNQPLEYWQKVEEERCREVTLMFRTLPFAQLVERQRHNVRDLGQLVHRVCKAARDKKAARFGNDPDKLKPKDFSDIKFPDLFVY